MERLVETEQDRRILIHYLERLTFPFVASVKDGRVRSYDQNRLQFLWAAEVAGALQDTTAREVQIEWKARFAAPILCGEDPKFADIWARAGGVLTYAETLEWLEYIPVTSLLTMKGFAEYLDQILRYYSEQGIKLTVPEDMRWLSDATPRARVDRREAKHTAAAAGQAPHRKAPRGKVR